MFVFVQVAAKKIEIRAPLDLPTSSQEQFFEVDHVFDIASTPAISESLVEVSPSQ